MSSDQAQVKTVHKSGLISSVALPHAHDINEQWQCPTKMLSIPRALEGTNSWLSQYFQVYVLARATHVVKKETPAGMWNATVAAGSSRCLLHARTGLRPGEAVTALAYSTCGVTLLALVSVQPSLNTC